MGSERLIGIVILNVVSYEDSTPWRLRPDTLYHVDRMSLLGVAFHRPRWELSQCHLICLTDAFIGLNLSAGATG